MKYRRYIEMAENTIPIIQGTRRMDRTRQILRALFLPWLNCEAIINQNMEIDNPIINKYSGRIQDSGANRPWTIAYIEYAIIKIPNAASKKDAILTVAGIVKCLSCFWPIKSMGTRKMIMKSTDTGSIS